MNFKTVVGFVMRDFFEKFAGELKYYNEGEPELDKKGWGMFRNLKPAR